MDRLAFYESLIGKPYKIGARGPDEFDCYGLARHIQISRVGIDMPDVQFAEPTTRAQAGRRGPGRPDAPVAAVALASDEAGELAGAEVLDARHLDKLAIVHLDGLHEGLHVCRGE